MAHPFLQAHVQPQPHVLLFDELGASRWAAARRAALSRASQRATRSRAGGATAETTGDALVAEDLSVRLGAGNERVQALRHATLRVKRGTLHMLLGPNGCGKVRFCGLHHYSIVLTAPWQSTLLRVCGGLLRPDGGRLRVAAPRAFVFQNPDHQVVMPSAGADVAFGLGRLGLPPSEVATRVEAALTAVGLQASAQKYSTCATHLGRHAPKAWYVCLQGFALRPVHTLSGGQKQRVAIAGALAEQPQVLLHSVQRRCLGLG